MANQPLMPEQLRRRCNPDDFPFETTADLPESYEFIGQPRAVEALRFGMGIRQAGFNLFALGPAGTGKHSLVLRYAAEQAATEAVPDDWCYVHNFVEAHRPYALRLPPGRAIALSRDMDRLVQDLGSSIAAAFESDEFRTRSAAIEQAFEERQEQAMEELNRQAKTKGIVIVRTPTGFTMGPLLDGKLLGPEEFHELPETEQKRIEGDIEELQDSLRERLGRVPQWAKESRERVDRLSREMAAASVSHLLGPLRERYGELPDVLTYLDAVEEDVVANYRRFAPRDQRKLSLLGIDLDEAAEEPAWSNRYRINVLLPHQDGDGAPVVYEDHPTHANLVGRVEHRAHQGVLSTDFTMIRPGALHRANGGTLVLDALKLLTQPLAWDALKRATRAGEVRIESLAQAMSLISTAALEPEPIPLEVKIVLIGDPHLYYLLAALDPEVAELFKVQVDFGGEMDWSLESQQLYAQLLATLARRYELLPFDRGAVARIIEESARLVGDREKLSTHMRSVADLMRESDYWARGRQTTAVGATDVESAVAARTRRADRLRERVQEDTLRGTILLDTAGERVGQINGLSVLSLGSFAFGRPTRITAQVRIGKGQVVDIEREVELGGPLHSKGVLILSHYLGARYALDHPLSLSASLVFEQSYGGVDGDSASSAELYALLSALSGLPLRQSLAVTGSVNQHGLVQAIGGVNEKIEGFFDTCRARGLSGDQGVLVPASNVDHLMLRRDVVEAVQAGQFAVYPIATIDEGIELLTGVPAGDRGDDGCFPPDSVNRRVEERLVAYSERLWALSGTGRQDEPQRPEKTP